MTEPEAHTKLVAFDEWSVTAFPSLFYGWAPKNSKPRVYWNRQQTRKRLTSLLAVDLHTGEETVALTPDGKSDIVAWFLYQVALDAHAEGATRLIVCLDNNPTHHDAMRYRLWWYLRAQPHLDDLRVDFLPTPAYSPDFNPAEYLIHLIRLKLLHHLPMGTSLADIANKLERYFTEGLSLLNPTKMANILRHIFELAPTSPSLKRFTSNLSQL